MPPAAGRPVPGGPRSVAEILDAPVARHPEREALVGRHSRYTYAELDRAADSATAALAGLGVRRGARVAACLPNDPDLVVAFLGAMRLGAIWVGVNRVLAAEEKLLLLRHSGASVLLADPQAASQLEPLRGEAPSLQAIVEAAPADAGSEWHQLLARAGASRRPAARVQVDPFAPAAIAYTSGTSGKPKGAVHSQHNLVVVGGANRVWGGWRAVPRQGAVLPLTILNIVALAPLLVFQLDGTCVCVDHPDPDTIAEWVRRERLQSFSSVPTIVHDLVEHPGVARADLASLTHLGAGGGPLPGGLADRFRERFGAEVLAGYGLTEAPSVVATQAPGHADPPGTCGRALPHLRITVRDEDGVELPAGNAGEICVERAPGGALAGVYTPFLGYWEDPEASSESLRQGRLHTGDQGRIGADGALVVEGRGGDVVVRAGATIAAGEVERVLQSDRRVAGAAVVGEPDGRLGERVVAFVELEPGLAPATCEELRSLCAAHLARYKVPDVIRVVDRFERNAMGKIQKRGLRERVKGGDL